MQYAVVLLGLLGLVPLANADIVVEDAYVLALPPGTTTTAAYMHLRNTGKDEVALLSAEAPLADKVTLHSSSQHEGMIHMMSAASLPIPAGGELALESGGHHLMLEGLANTLVPGTEVELSLHFSDGSSAELQVPVRSLFDQ